MSALYSWRAAIAIVMEERSMSWRWLGGVVLWCLCAVAFVAAALAAFDRAERVDHIAILLLSALGAIGWGWLLAWLLWGRK